MIRTRNKEEYHQKRNIEEFGGLPLSRKKMGIWGGLGLDIEEKNRWDGRKESIRFGFGKVCGVGCLWAVESYE